LQRLFAEVPHSFAGLIQLQLFAAAFSFVGDSAPDDLTEQVLVV
jgi:hypothetical protein